MSVHAVDGNLMAHRNRAAINWLAAGAILAAAGVALGAFGAHGVKNIVLGDPADVQRRLGYWETATLYWMYHSFGIIAVSIAALSLGCRQTLRFSNGLFVVGIAIFSGCLYVMALTDLKILGAIVPLGGLSFILGWITFAIGIFASETNGDTNGIH